MQTWLALPDGEGGDRPGVRPCRRATGCRWSRTTASGAGADGELVGRDSPRTLPFADHLCRHRARAGRSRSRSTHEADERALMLVGGRRASSTATRSSPFTLYRPAPRAIAPRLSARAAARADAAGRRRLRHAAPRLLEFRLLVARPDQPGQGGLEGGRFPLSAGDDEEFIPLPAVPQDGQLSVTEFRRVALTTGVTLNVALGRRPADAPPVILLHGFPESHRTWREVAPLLRGPLPAGHARPARLRRLRPAAGGRGLYDRQAGRRHLRAGRRARASSASRWSATIGAGRSPGPRRCAAIRGSTRLAIVNAPHPVIFQKSLIEDADQRAASQYINAFRTPGFEKAVEAMGFDDVLRQELRRPCRPGADPGGGEARNISPTGRSPAR